ncbi:unnamed protein product, partial [Candidula unifasciata]
MKRSAAPSQIGTAGEAKRQKFVSPATRPYGTDESERSRPCLNQIIGHSALNSSMIRQPVKNVSLQGPLATSHQRVPRLFNNVIRN